MTQLNKRLSPTLALVIAIAVAFAGVVLVGMAVKVTADFDLPDVARAQTIIGLVIILGLAGLSWFEAYRFGRFFKRERILRQQIFKS